MRLPYDPPDAMTRLLPPPPEKFKAVLAVAGTIIVLCGVLTFVDDYGYLGLREIQRQHSGLEHEVFSLLEYNQEARSKILRIESDRRFIEKLARERLGFVRPDEIIYTLPTGDGAAR